MYEETLTVMCVVGWGFALVSFMISLYLLRQYRILKEIHKEERFLRNFGYTEYLRRRNQEPYDYKTNPFHFFDEPKNFKQRIALKFRRSVYLIKHDTKVTINWILGNGVYNAAQEKWWF